MEFTDRTHRGDGPANASTTGGAVTQPAAGAGPTLSRRAVLRHTAAAAAGAITAGCLTERVRGTAAAAPSPTPGEADLKPGSAIESILAAMERFPLVAIGERHLLQEMHDFLTALLLDPGLPGRITDIVVEFGNALHQGLADQFILGNRPTPRAELAQIWRFTIGGDVYWDAPVYEQFFRTVRAVNSMLPPARRIRVLLGDPPFDHRKVRSAADKGYLRSVQGQRDAHYASVVEQEVLRKGRRALLIAGSNHLRRGLQAGEGATGLNAASLLVQRHPGMLHVVDLLVLPPGPQQDPLVQRAAANVEHWPRRAVASLAGTWLGGTTQSAPPWINSGAYLAATPAAARYGAQADAILYLGPGELLTASQADPSLYQSGAYRNELARLSRVVTQIEGHPVDFAAEGLRHARLGPSWFAQWQGGGK